MSSRTGFYLQQVGLVEKQLVGNAHLFFIPVLKYSHENLSPIEWKPCLSGTPTSADGQITFWVMITTNEAAHLCFGTWAGKITHPPEMVSAVWQGGYNFYCQDTHSAGETDTKIINVLWWYYFSKVIEFMDTFFFILRKNNHQITFLHIYHHASMLNIWWFVMNWVPCGHSYFGASLNSFIHVLMYSYYGLSAVPAIRPYLWWKKYITQGQLIQFFLTMYQTICAVIWPCGFPRGWLFFQIFYMASLIAFFSNFYIQTYKKHRVSQKEYHQNVSVDSLNGHANGVTPTETITHRKVRVD
uniref:Elongation of very long chain fatty acids protein n=1 Tax=Salmo trutta TaxID=8032 RepID=A0A674D1G3_SALTR